MSYIIIAEVETDAEVNVHGDCEKVEARVLSRRFNNISFDVCATFETQAELTLKLCTSLITAGYLEFSIRHSY